MAVWTVGSINVDHVYGLDRLPAPGETISARSLTSGLGGKGANQSVAVARAGATSYHVGAVGDGGHWARDALAEYGVDVSHVAVLDMPTGHAIINLDSAGENAIVVFPGANRALDPAVIDGVLANAAAGDILMMQNETNATVEAAKAAKARGLHVVYSAAPFELAAIEPLFGLIDTLAVNEGEADEKCRSLGKTLEDLPVSELLMTRGGEGASLYSGGTWTHVESHKVEVRDTVGAGDTFAGYFAAMLDQGRERGDALRIANAAGALKVTRPGAAGGIPSLAEVEAFLAG